MILLRWFATIAALGFACSFAPGQYFYEPENPDFRRRELRVRSPSSLRSGSDSEGSCGESEIQQNVTLRGGIRAGYFRKLAQYVAMKLCVELCCEEKGCDVAFMTGRNCYGVQCFSEEQCQSIPSKNLPSEQIFVSHVTFKGEGSQKAHEPKNLKCSATRMKVGVTLRGGLKAGNFTDVGKVDSMVICTKLCCVAERCDLAMMINQSCFLVACYTMQLCQAVKAISNKYQPSVAYVMRRTGELQEETATKLQALHTSDSKLMCKNSQIFFNSTLRGGYKAGNFTDLGKVPNMSACVRLCCGDKNCDAAFMLEKNCYAVACIQEDLCTPVHAKKSGALISLNPRISYITSRTEEVESKKLISADGTCHAGVISYDVTLRGGMSAGNFTPHGKVGSMETCIEKCCRQVDCNAAMMLKDACFTVSCQKDELCEKKPIPTSSSYNPKIAFVYREKKPKKKATKHVVTMSQRPTLLTKPAFKHGIGKSKERVTLDKNMLLHGNSNSLHRQPPIQHTKNGSNSFKLTVNRTHKTEGTNGLFKASKSPNVKNESTTAKPSSFHEMVEYITTGWTTKSAAPKPGPGLVPSFTAKSREQVPVDSLEDQFVKLTTKQPGSPVQSQNTNTKGVVLGPSIEHTKKTTHVGRILSHKSAVANTTDTRASNGGDEVQDLVKQLERNNFEGSNSSFEISGDGEDYESPENSSLILSQKTDSYPTANISNEEYSVKRFPGISFIGDDVGCTNSEIIRNVTLRGGITSGKFRDRGVMKDFRQCISICCLSKLCDLAFMLRNNCFTVECKSEELCEAVPVKTSKESPPFLAYIYARSTPVMKRNTSPMDVEAAVVLGDYRSSRNGLHVAKRTIEVLMNNRLALLLKKRSAASDSADEPSAASDSVEEPIAASDAADKRSTASELAKKRFNGGQTSNFDRTN